MSEKKKAERKKEETMRKQVMSEEKSAVIYLGPAIAGVAVPGTVYRNGVTPQMQKAVGEVPASGRLLVPVEHTAKMRKELRDSQTAASVCYQKALEYATQKGAEK